MTDKFLYIPNIDKHNNPFCGLQLVIEIFGHTKKPINENPLKVPKVVEQTNKKSF